jgi:DNA-binding PadR family transcriptional regulator
MEIEDIYKFFENRSPTFLNAEVTVCYILHTLLQGDSYGTELIQRLRQQHPTLSVSDTVLYDALKFLEQEEFLTKYVGKLEGRGRPRQMLQLAPEFRAKAQEFANLWENFVAHH